MFRRFPTDFPQQKKPANTDFTGLASLLFQKKWEIQKIPVVRRKRSAERPCRILLVNRFLYAFFQFFKHNLKLINT